MMKICRPFLDISLKDLHKIYLRSSSFKVLNNDLDFDGPQLEKANTRAIAANNLLSLLTKFIHSGGGEKAIHKHTAIKKKLLVRERLKLLFDPDSHFLEFGLLTGLYMDYGTIPASGFIAGVGKIHGKYCLVGANDATVKGGTIFPISLVKQIRMHQLSYLNKLPCIYLVDSGGAFLPLQAEIFPDKEHGGRVFYNEAVLSSLKIPQIAIVCGNSTAGGAYLPTMAEEAIIVNKTGLIFLGGPPLVKAATGEIVAEQDLGGATMHCSVSGCTDYFAETEEEALNLCRESVLTLDCPVGENLNSYSDPIFPTKELLLLSGKEKLLRNDMYAILSRILDGSMFKEFKEKFGDNLITGFGYIKGILVGILANCNSLSYKDAQKGSHFIQLCEKRNIPLCFMQNSGNLDDAESSDEQYDNLANKARMVYTHSCSKVPKISLCVGGCYGDDNFTMCGWDFNPNFFLTWPLSHISQTRSHIQKVKLEETSMLENGINDFEDCEFFFSNFTSAFHKSSRMLCDAVIAPEDTREILGICLNIVTRK